MEVLQERIHYTQFPNFIPRHGSAFFLRLVGVNLSHRKKEVVIEPVYQPVVAIDVRGRITFVYLGWNKPKWILYFFPSRPFVHIEKVTSVEVHE